MDTLDNLLCAGLDLSARTSLLSIGEVTRLTLSQVLSEAGAPVLDVYFPMHGFISLVAGGRDSGHLEVGMIGSEGMFGASVVLGVAVHPLRAVVQGAGDAWRIPAADFAAELDRSAPLRRAMSRYLYILYCQQANAAVCLRFHALKPRLAKWLLMSHDRSHSHSFHFTQEFLAYMIGMRRVGVTNAASDLQRQGLIAYQRGEMHILDRGGLEAAACGCYAADRAVYKHILD